MSRLQPLPDGTGRASVRIQRFWRLHSASTSRLTTNYRSLGLAPDELPLLDFSAAMTKLREPDTVTHTKLLLTRVLQVAAVLGREATVTRHHPRAFLAAYLVVYYPAHVFGTRGGSEMAVMTAASALLRCVNAIVALLAIHASLHAVPRELVLSLPVLLKRYEEVFTAWKQPDAAKLVDRIKHALVALFTAELSVQGTPLDEMTRLELRMQTDRLRQKLLELGGERAVAELDQVLDWEMAANAHTNTLDLTYA
jgi:hypothetical protein